VHIKHKQPLVLSPDSHVTLGMIQQTQSTYFEYIDTIVSMRLDQWSYWDSWRLVGRPWHHQHKIWL